MGDAVKTRRDWLSVHLKDWALNEGRNTKVVPLTSKFST